ncbi:hypothetical protein RF11_04710 [Thelohanellus kitauei]|uniref:Uncharacterized protein n=1 Tax=Thelohanellus kitauei TaxID=669202 RepID=A0A0C2JV79_THEKT|nr:hypothetical protein RF11_04710 [Thelohanellus kitauei]
MDWDHAHVSQHHISVTGHANYRWSKGDLMTIKMTYNLKPKMTIDFPFLGFLVEVFITGFFNATYISDNHLEIDQYQFFTESMVWDNAYVSQHHISVTGHPQYQWAKDDFMTIKMTYNLQPDRAIQIVRVSLVFDSLRKRRIIGGLRLSQLVKPPMFEVTDLIIDFFTEDVHSSSDISINIGYIKATFINTVIYFKI